MFFAGMNFMIHYRVIFSGKFDLLKNDREFRFYLAVIVTAVLLGTVVLQTSGVSSMEAVDRSFRNQKLSEEAASR